MMEGKKSTDSQSRRGRPMNVFFSFFLFLLLLLLLPYYVAAQPSNDGRFSNTNENFRPSMTVTIVVLAVACVVIAFFSFYIRRCSRDIHINGGGGASLRLTRTRPAPVGLDASVIETFPTFLYSVVKGLKIGKGVLECAVCLNEFEDDETLRLLPKCDHVFHPECIDAWLSSHTTCPVCRAQLVPHDQSSSPQLVTPVSEESDIQPLNQQQQQQSSSSSSSSPAPEITQVSIHVVDDDDEPKPDVIATTTTTVPIQNRPVRSKSMIKRIAGRFPRSHSTGHSVVQPTGGAAVDNYDRFTLKLPDDVRKQILNGKLSRTMSCVVTTGSVSSSGWRNDSIRRTSRRSSAGGGWSNHFGFGRNSMDRTTAAAAAATKSGRWGFLRSASFLWRNNSSARLSKKGDGSTSKSDVVVLGTGGSQSPSSSTVRRPPV